MAKRDTVNKTIIHLSGWYQITQNVCGQLRLKVKRYSLLNTSFHCYRLSLDTWDHI